MALQILRNKGTFYLNGNINFSTLSLLSTYFNSIEKNTITLNIDNLKNINKEGLNAIFVILNNINKVFYIEGTVITNFLKILLKKK